MRTKSRGIWSPRLSSRRSGVRSNKILLWARAYDQQILRQADPSLRARAARSLRMTPGVSFFCHNPLPRQLSRVPVAPVRFVGSPKRLLGLSFES